MTARQVYFRLHGEPGSIYVTFIAGNGERTWITAQGGSKGKQGYSRRREAYAAIELFCGPRCVSSWESGRMFLVYHPGYDTSLPIRDEVAKRRPVAA